MRLLESDDEQLRMELEIDQMMGKFKKIVVSNALHAGDDASIGKK